MSVSGNGSFLANKTEKHFSVAMESFSTSSQHPVCKTDQCVCKNCKDLHSSFLQLISTCKSKRWHQGRRTHPRRIQCNFLKTERLFAQKVDKSRENIFPPLVVAEEDTAGRTNAGRPPRAAIIQLFIGRMACLGALRKYFWIFSSVGDNFPLQAIGGPSQFYPL